MMPPLNSPQLPSRVMRALGKDAQQVAVVAAPRAACAKARS